ncbi:MAG: response regulator [Lachnospiraceae bacterium]|nr:response regulator [Lachnospiraceae bacterium]
MADFQVILLGEKETFIARVLVKKASDSGTPCKFVPFTINDINHNMEGTALVILCMGEDEKPREDVFHFLLEKLEEHNLQLILVGEQAQVHLLADRIPPNMVYASFIRPVDNDEFAKTVADYLIKAAAGIFKKSILVVDDDTGYLKLVREWLKDEYNVSMASSGLQAIKYLGKNKVDLILLDHEMPVTSGPQVLEMLRSDPETRSIPVIFLTGKSDRESVMAVVNLKPEGYFLKTIDKKELLSNLSKFFLVHGK